MRKSLCIGVGTVLALLAPMFLASCTSDEPKVLLKQVENTVEGSRSKVVYEYDENGNLTTIVNHYNGNELDNSNKTVRSYDESQRLVSETIYYGGNPSYRTLYSYTEEGDTTCIVNESYSEERWNVLDKKSFVYEDGRKARMYEIYSYMSEGEGESHNMLTEHIYDANGKEAESTYYDFDYSSDIYEITVEEKYPGTPEQEYKHLQESYTFADPCRTVFRYNENGKLVSALTKNRETGEKVSEIKNTYDGNGNLTEQSTTYGEGTPYICRYSYDTEGRMLTSHSGDAEGTWGTNVTISYNEKGDTAQAVYVFSGSSESFVSKKLRYMYDADGRLVAKYEFAAEDDWGHDERCLTKYTYNQYGKVDVAKSYIMSDWDTEFHISETFSGTPEEEFNQMIGDFGMEQAANYVFTYLVIEKPSFFDSLFGWTKKKDVPKSNSGVEYDI